MKLKFGSVLLLLLFTAGCGSETVNEAPTKKVANVDEVVEAAETEEVEDFLSADLTTLKEAVPALTNELSKRLNEVKLPTDLDDFYNRPISNASIEKDSFEIYLSLEDTTGRPFNLSVSTRVENYQQFIKDGYTTQMNENREYLVSLDKEELVFVDGEYLYQLDSISTLMGYMGDTLAIDELLAIAKGMSTESEYKEYFRPDLEVYYLPTYFTHDGKEPYRLFVGYDGDGGYFDPEAQTLQISNDTVILEQSALYSSYEPYGEEINIDGQLGYLSYGDNAQFDLVNSERLFTVRLAILDVNQSSGKPSYVEVPNWKKEVAKIIKSINLPVQQEDVPTMKEDTAGQVLTEQQQRETDRRMETIKEVYIESTLDDSVFNQRALQFNYLGPEIAVGYIQDQLFKRFIHVDKEFEKLNVNNMNSNELSSDAASSIQDLLEFNSIDPNEVFLMKDESLDEQTLYWLLQMDNSVAGYRVINIYDAVKEMFLSDF